ncbi:hypothetical protein AERO_18585 [Aeromicrobium fastidiosum]|nr:hypothetical protein [Aeromicrobium fastidiosum]MCL8253391.1 hypothetical protein [Aeromicrobium fastidiosum]
MDKGQPRARDVRAVAQGAGQTGVGGHLRHRPSARRDGSRVVGGPERRERLVRGVERGARRCVEQGETVPVGVSPRRELEAEARQVGDRDLGRGVRRQMGVVGARPAACLLYTSDAADEVRRV